MISNSLQVLHVAVLRQRKETVQALLGAEFPVGEESSRGWLALEVAVEAEDRAMVKVSCCPSGPCVVHTHRYAAPLRSCVYGQGLDRTGQATQPRSRVNTAVSGFARKFLAKQLRRTTPSAPLVTF